MKKTFTKQQLLNSAKELRATIAKLEPVRKAYKTAQMGEPLTPEQVKDIAMESESGLANIMQEANNIAEMQEAIAEGVPAEEESPLDEGPLNEGPSEEETPGLESNIENLRDRDEEEDPRKLIGSLRKELDEIKFATAKEKLATQYASLWPAGKQASAKFASFMKSNDSLPILEARIAEAKSIMGNPANSKQKQASMPSWSVHESFNNSDNTRIASSENDSTRFDIANTVSMKV